MTAGYVAPSRKQTGMSDSKAPLSALLVFINAEDERKYVEARSGHIWEHDKQAAAIYLLMVASGSLLYLIISIFMPAAKADRVDSCVSLIICSWVGPAMQLLVMSLIPKITYQQHRTLITLGFRAFYLLATSKNGFGVCGVGGAKLRANLDPAAAVAAPAAAQLESPFSAFTWRSGVIGLVWYSSAFPLPFRHHIWVQTLFLTVYCKTLSPVICDTLDRVKHGSQIITAIRSFADLIWSQILAAIGAPAAAAQKFAAAAAVEAREAPGFSAPDQTLDAARNYGGAAAVGYGQCMHGLCFLQSLVGYALPTVILYCVEYRNRVHWWLAQQSREQSSGSSSGSGMFNTLSPGQVFSDSSIVGSSSSGSREGLTRALPPSGEQVAAAAAATETSAAAAATIRKRSATAAAVTPSTVAPRSISGSSSGGSSSRTVTGLTAFGRECIEDSLPPTFKEVYLVCVGLGIAWIVLGYLVSHGQP